MPETRLPTAGNGIGAAPLMVGREIELMLAASHSGLTPVPSWTYRFALQDRYLPLLYTFHFISFHFYV
jgi:hypothetical protein